MKNLRRIRRPFAAMLLGGVLAGMACFADAAPPAPAIRQVARIPNTTNPELLYWFISPSEIKDHAYVQDLDAIAAGGTFDLVFLTQRDGADFYDFPAMHPILKDLVARAHAKGIKVGLQLWADERRAPADQTQAVVVEKELTLDATGQADYTAESKDVRLVGNSAFFSRVGVRSELLRAYAFRKTADGEYDPGSVVDITNRTHATSRSATSVVLHFSASPQLAGSTVYVMTAHYHQYPDVFSPFMQNSLIGALQAYRDVGFDGAALDEFGYMAFRKEPKEPFRGRLYSRNMAAFYRERTGQDLVQTLFDMRYAPRGDSRPRARAINNYFDMLRQGPLRVEESFFKATAKIFGPRAFHGLHDTFHNHLDSDEIWSTGINWWSVPRDYSQTDESTPMTTRLGMGLARPKAVEYNQCHSNSVQRYLREGIEDARFNVRVDYHALNDRRTGKSLDMRQPDLMAGATAVEDKVRLLNHFDAPRPAMNVLYLFGYPALANWFPIASQRSEWDINGSLKAEEKAVAAWNAGYRGAFASSCLIDEGKITSDGAGGIVFGGHRFTAVVYIGPQYSKTSTLRLLESFTAAGGKLMLDGMATEDFTAQDIRERFGKLAQAAVATSFTVDAMSKLGVPKLAIEEGALYEDGSVVLADLDSLMHHQPKPFSVQVAGHTFSGAYLGVLAIKSDAEGRVVKLAAGGLRELKRDGTRVVSLSEPSDIVLLRDAGGGYRGMVQGAATVTVR